MNLRTKKRVDYYLGGALIAVFRPMVFVVGKILRRSHEVRSTGRIVVLKFMGGGSLVLAFPALLGIRRQYPQRRLELVCTKAVADFAQALHLFDHIHVIDDTSLPRLLLTSFRALLRGLMSDTVLDLEMYSRLSTVFGLFMMARNRAGFYMESNFWRKFLYTHLFYFNRSTRVTEFYDQLAYHLQARPASPTDSAAHIRQHLTGSSAVPSARRTIVIAPGCSDQGRERQLTPAQWAIVAAKRLNGPAPAHLLFLGGNGDRVLAEAIIHKIKPMAPANTTFENACGTGSLSDAAGRLTVCSEFWGIDSGLLHLARLLTPATLSYWGPTDPATRLLPVPGLREEVLYERISCSPCIHVTEHPPCEGDNRCIQRLFDPSVRVEGADAAFTAWPKRL